MSELDRGSARHAARDLRERALNRLGSDLSGRRNTTRPKRQPQRTTHERERHPRPHVTIQAHVRARSRGTARRRGDAGSRPYLRAAKHRCRWQPTLRRTTEDPRMPIRSRGCGFPTLTWSLWLAKGGGVARGRHVATFPPRHALAIGRTDLNMRETAPAADGCRMQDTP